MLPCDNNRIVAIKIQVNGRILLVFSVYMPTDGTDNLPEFTDCLGNMKSTLENNDAEAVYILCDFNAHPNELLGRKLVLTFLF